MMKKFICIILTMFMLASSTVAFAGNGNGKGKGGKITNYNNEKYYSDIKDLEKQLKKYHNDDKQRNKFITQLIDLKNKLSDSDKNYKHKALTIYLNGVEFESNNLNLISYSNINIPVDLIERGLGANLQYNSSSHIMTITKGSVKLVINLRNRNVTLNGEEVRSNILKKANSNNTIHLIKYIAETLGYKIEVKEKDGILVIESEVNLAANKPSSSDSEQSGYSATKGNDENSSTRWCAADGSLTHWWKVDLGNYYSLRGSEVSWEFNNKIYKYKIDVSTDNNNWTSILNKSNNTDSNQIQKDAYNVNSVRFVRISVVGLDAGCWPSFYEFKVFGSQQITDTSIPTIPQALSAATQSTSQININWTASSDNLGVAGYKVFRNNTQIATVTNGTSYSDIGLAAGTAYSYTVSAYDGAGNNSSQCPAITAATFSNNAADTQAPTVPTGLVASAVSATQINLSWVNSTDAVGVAGYKVFRNGIQIGMVSTVTNYFDTGLAASTGYLYSVCAYDTAGNNSPQCTQVQAVTAADAVAPTVPAGLTATAISTTQVNLSWTASTDHFGVTGYKVFRGGVQIATVTNATTYVNTGLTANTAYSYTVSAFDAAGNNSAQCAAFSVTTKTPTITVINDNTLGTGDNQFNYSGTWDYGAHTGAYSDDNHWSVAVNAFYQVQFTGTQIKLYGAKDPSHGIATILIDGIVVGSVDFYAAARTDNVLVFTSQLLQLGQHNLKVVVTGTKNISSTNYYIPGDRVDVIGG
jgi:chitodextrinase